MPRMESESGGRLGLDMAYEWDTVGAKPRGRNVQPQVYSITQVMMYGIHNKLAQSRVDNNLRGEENNDELPRSNIFISKRNIRASNHSCRLWVHWHIES